VPAAAGTPQKGAFVPFWICSISAAGAMPRSEGSAVDAASRCWPPQRTSTPQRRWCYSKESSSRCARLCVATTAAEPSKRAQLLPRGRCKGCLSAPVVWGLCAAINSLKHPQCREEAFWVRERPTTALRRGGARLRPPAMHRSTVAVRLYRALI
jgi:hypothetical protein